MTNLYLQNDFQSFEVALTYHIGIVHTLNGRDAAPMTPEQRNRGPAAWRKWEQAAEALDSAEEAEDFQAVGMRLREGLITFGAVNAGQPDVFRHAVDECEQGIPIRDAHHHANESQMFDGMRACGRLLG